MDSKSFILGLLNAAPQKRVTGKKRLQKLSVLLKLGGADLDADFTLLHYGPFSYDIADAADELALTGKIDEALKPVGVYGTFQSEYSLPEDVTISNVFPDQIKTLQQELEAFSTTELEVASTIAFLMRKGSSYDDAMAETRAIKPNKTIPAVLQKADNVLSLISLRS